jgi:uncharacterized membrane protein
MLSIIITTIAGIISFIVLDYIWLTQIAKSLYLEKLASHVNIENGSLVPYLPAIPIVYGVAIFAIWIFVLSWATDLKQAALYGALFGFCMYAFYDFTNLATLKDYPWSLTLIDTLWGTFVVGVVTAIMFYVNSLFA